MLIRDERHREEAENKKRDLTLKRSSVADKLLLTAQSSMQNGMFFEQVHEYPHRKETYHTRLMMPLPMLATDLWIARSYLDNDMEAFRPRSNFQLDLFGNY